MKNTHLKKEPSLWIITFIVILPMISESIYIPSLPTLAKAFLTTAEQAERTLSIYLAGFAIGVFLWGNLSDKYGRKPILIYGFSIYTVSCLGCFLSKSIESFMIFRALQGIGGAVGSVVGQAIARDSFEGSRRGVVYSTIGMALAFAPAVGPLIGGSIVEYVDWKYVFIFLLSCGTLLIFKIYLSFRESIQEKSKIVFDFSVIKRIFLDPNIIVFSIIIGTCNGITYSYYSEGAFYFIDMLHVSPRYFGRTFMLIAAAGFLGGYISKYLNQRKYPAINIIKVGVLTVIISMMINVFIAIIVPPSLSLTLTSLVFFSFCMAGIGMIIPNAFYLAQENYKSNAGTMSSVMGCLYYMIISLQTYGMSVFRDGTLSSLPKYLLFLGVIMTIPTTFCFYKKISHS